MKNTEDRVREILEWQTALLLSMTEVGTELARLGRLSGAVLLNAVDDCRRADALQGRAAAGRSVTTPEDLS